MLERGFLQERRRKPENKKTATVGNILFIVGVVILIGSFIYMMLNAERADKILNSWMLFIIVGLGLLFAGILIKRFAKPLR